VNDFGEIAIKQAESPADIDDMHRHIQAVQDQNAGVKCYVGGGCNCWACRRIGGAARGARGFAFRGPFGPGTTTVDRVRPIHVQTPVLLGQE
jgi:hypothetical protein